MQTSSDVQGLRGVARVNLAAIERNVARVARELAPGVELCAVVKGDGYGHGAVRTARTALAAGARRLAVSTALEAKQLRAAGIEAPLLVMSALSASELDVALGARADVVAWDERFVRAVAARGGGAIHVYLDTGMGSVGVRGLEEVRAIAREASESENVTLIGAMTQFAAANDREDGSFAEDVQRFESWVRPLKAAQPSLVVHAANSPSLLRDPATQFDMVRVGDLIYGLDPFTEDPDLRGVEPALELSTYVAAIRAIAPGESAGYGRRFVATAPTHVATLPMGYGDGLRRTLAGNGEALVRGVRYPIVGAVAMDHVMLDIGSLPRTDIGERAVLIGTRDGERITAEEVARRVSAINAEVTCGLSRRVERLYHRDGRPA